MKTRNISPSEYLDALQREYICLEIRSKIYIFKSDREYFKKLMVKKEGIIDNISSKNYLENIFNNRSIYLKIWKEIVPQFGFPKLIYNIVNVSEKDLKFPWKGTVVKSTVDYIYGISKKVDFDNNYLELDHKGSIISLPMSECERCSPQETDEFYYYYPGNFFMCDLGSDYNRGTLSTYDIKSKEANICFDGMACVNLPSHKISRIL